MHCKLFQMAFITILIALANTLSAQGIFLEEGQSGGGWQLGYLPGKYASSVSFEFGVSFLGRVDLSGILGKTNPKEPEQVDISSRGLSLALHLTKPKEKGLGVVVSGGAASHDIGPASAVIGAGFYGKQTLNAMTELIPHLSFSKTFNKGPNAIILAVGTNVLVTAAKQVSFFIGLSGVLAFTEIRHERNLSFSTGFIFSP